MKSFLVRLGILLLVFLTLSCSLVNELMQNGIGQPIFTIIDQWGPPSRVSPDGKGGQIYIWEQWEGSGYGDKRLWSLTFWADASGIVYQWR